jgi:serine/threonine protein kinase
MIDEVGLTQAVRNHIELLKKISHPNIVPLKEIFDLDNAFCLVLELLENSLSMLLSSQLVSAYLQGERRRFPEACIGRKEGLH